MEMARNREVEGKRKVCRAKKQSSLKGGKGGDELIGQKDLVEKEKGRKTK